MIVYLNSWTNGISILTPLNSEKQIGNAGINFLNISGRYLKTAAIGVLQSSGGSLKREYDVMR